MRTSPEFTGFEDLDDFNTVKVTQKPQETFPCIKCAGTGFYRGVRIHQEKSHCFACKGKGYFLTSPQAREKAKLSRVARKAEKQDAARRAADEFASANRELVDFLLESSSWSGFASNLIDSIHKYGKLSDNQKNAALRMMDTCLARKAEKAAQRAKEEAAKPVISLERINALFETAKNNGLKKPKLRIGELLLKEAPVTGRNVGYLYVMDKAEYAGKISPEGVLTLTRHARPEIEEELKALADDPLKAATAYGNRTGNCSCCGRELTNADSVAAGIGPVCAKKWGM